MSNKPKTRPKDMLVDDDAVVYNIKNKQGKLLGKFEFHPSDTNIVKRYEEVATYFNNFVFP